MTARGPSPASVSEEARGRIFLDPPIAPRQRRARLVETHRALPGTFATFERCREFFGYMVTPQSGRWAFRPNGKSGTTSALNALFHVEFGHPFTARLQDPASLNTNNAIHKAAQNDVFRMLADRSDVADLPGYLHRTLYIATVRDPGRRAVSAFHYLCLSHRRAHWQFAHDRFRMAATVAFDWDRHPETPDGFVRFLDYIRLRLEGGPEILLDNHFRPQHDTIRPDLFKPDILGRTEDLAGFYRALAAALRPGLDEDDLMSASRHNAGSARPDADVYLTAPGAAERLVACYGPDYEAFGYDPLGRLATIA